MHCNALCPATLCFSHDGPNLCGHIRRCCCSRLRRIGRERRERDLPLTCLCHHKLGRGLRLFSRHMICLCHHQLWGNTFCKRMRLNIRLSILQMHFPVVSGICCTALPRFSTLWFGTPSGVRIRIGCLSPAFSCLDRGAC